jgi:hypothetical protein
MGTRFAARESFDPNTLQLRTAKTKKKKQNPQDHLEKNQMKRIKAKQQPNTSIKELGRICVQTIPSSPRPAT